MGELLWAARASATTAHLISCYRLRHQNTEYAHARPATARCACSSSEWCALERSWALWALHWPGQASRVTILHLYCQPAAGGDIQDGNTRTIPTLHNYKSILLTSHNTFSV